jgi:hypothetical protein
MYSMRMFRLVEGGGCVPLSNQRLSFCIVAPFLPEVSIFALKLPGFEVSSSLFLLVHVSEVPRSGLAGVGIIPKGVIVGN